jgi:hypothetical protein
MLQPNVMVKRRRFAQKTNLDGDWFSASGFSNDPKYTVDNINNYKQFNPNQNMWISRPAVAAVASLSNASIGFTTANNPNGRLTPSNSWTFSTIVKKNPVSADNGWSQIYTVDDVYVSVPRHAPYPIEIVGNAVQQTLPPYSGERQVSRWKQGVSETVTNLSVFPPPLPISAEFPTSSVDADWTYGGESSVQYTSTAKLLFR